jgi:hypothetical protein
MGTYREPAQRIRWRAKSRSTGSVIARAAAVAVTLSFAVAACGSAASSTSASGTSSATPSASAAAPSVSATAAAAARPSASGTAAAASVITPGHSTPEDAEAGLIKGELTNNWSQACSYIVPSSQAACLQAAQSRELPTFTGQATVDSAAISGTDALVVVTGSMCSSSTGCLTNSVGSTGMPDTYVTFTQAYAQVLDNTSDTSLSPVPCIEENGLWFINATL